jgi:hypothetical protein
MVNEWLLCENPDNSVPTDGIQGAPNAEETNYTVAFA